MPLPDVPPGLAEGLAAQGNNIPPLPMEDTSASAPSGPEEMLAFDDAARDVFDALKADNYETFKAALLDAVVIAMNAGP